MEEQLRQLLQNLADEAPPQGGVPPGLVGRARRRMALVVGTAAIAVAAVLAGSVVGVRTLAFGRPSGNVPASRRPPVSPSAAPAPFPTPTPSPSPAPSGSPSHLLSPAAPPPTASIPTCSYRDASASVQSNQGAAGTIYVVWKVANTGSTACRSSAYPGMDFRASGGWLNVQVRRGTTRATSAPVSRIVVPAGGSLYFLSDWSDVGTATDPSCTQFDRVKITLPDNFVSLEVPFGGCVTPSTAEVGAVTLHPSGT